MKKMKWIIISLAVMIIILLIVLLTLPKKSNTNETQTNNVEEKKEENFVEDSENEEDIYGINKEPGYVEFFTVSNCISQYLDYKYLNNSIYFDREMNETVSNEEKSKIVKSLLSPNNNSNIELLKDKNIFTPINILQKTMGNVSTYAVYGIIANTNMENIKDQYFVVNLDMENSAFSIEEINSNNIDISRIEVKDLQSIEKNDYNAFTYQAVDEQFTYKKIFDNIKKLMLIKPELAYQKLDEEYKAKRFGNYENFKQYIENNREHFIGITPKSYKLDKNNKLLMLDQHSVWYEFNVTGTMKYTAKIDNFVEMFEQDVTKYNGYTEEKKIRYNINRWIKMIDSKEYNVAYKYLDDTFKNNNYKTVEEFAKFIGEKYPDWYNNVEIKLEKEGNTYKAEVELSIEDEEFSDKYITIFMRLDEEKEFTMSFEAK